MPDSPVLVVTISCPDRDTATRLGRELVAERLVACAQLLPIHSIYRWEGAVQTEDEYLLQAKTTEARLADIESYVAEHHPYEVPELIAMPISWGHGPYLEWVREQTRNST
jgi:periplasmic divalent cation tolerance protein